MDFPFAVPYNLPEMEPIALQAFTYNTVPIDIAPGQQVSRDIQIDADAEFWASKFMAGYSYAEIAGEPVVTVRPWQECKPQQLPLLVNIKDTGDGKDLNKNTVYIGSIAGDANLPYILPIPRRIAPVAVIQFQFLNTSSDVTIYGFQFTMAGGKVYYPSAQYGTRGAR